VTRGHGFFGFAVWLAVGAAGSAASAQDGEVALVVTGPSAADARSAFVSFVDVPPALRFDAAPDAPPNGVELLVRIDTEAPAVRVWRRRDGAVLERRFDEAQDGYALAVVAAELLEVARTGADPAAVGATLVEPEPEASPELEPEPEPPEPEVAPEELAPRDDVAWAIELTPGLGVEGWFSIDGDPWIVQPTVFFEVLGGPAGEAWRIGGALFASALGQMGVSEGELQGSYARHDVGARLSVGGDVGPVGTRLLGHVRVGGAAVIGSAERQGRDDDRRESARPGWFVGLGLDVRQPLIEGLELFLDLSADVLPAPVRFEGEGRALVAEPWVRLGGRLGLAWRVIP